MSRSRGFKANKVSPFVVVDVPEPAPDAPTVFLPVVSTDMGAVGCADPLTGGAVNTTIGPATDTDLAIP
jgi:hypothetical protein